ncbi:uncharacterized protein B0H64DRAFT_411639 [Chaetomium fimeti]|uniref:Uncharacterized protein n=1 Tax=Chaetomium fimeti TaxID=1854472 RepID=A0AAE0H6H1_9PEZI|nr:hypothetical protein B0H64DRAFT_411639 [Chaetomium fimeti]
MNRLSAVLAFLPPVFATPLVKSAQGAQAVNVQLQVNKITSEAAVDIWNSDKAEILAHSCSHSLTSGPFVGMPLAFAVNENGAGELSIGSEIYTIYDDAEVSGGIVCGRIASTDELGVSCDVSVPASIQLKSLTKSDLQDCFPRGPVELSSFIKGVEGATTSDAAWAVDNFTLHQADITTPSNDKRQGSCGSWTPRTYLVGNGNPHQNPLNIQIRPHVLQLTSLYYRVWANSLFQHRLDRERINHAVDQQWLRRGSVSRDGKHIRMRWRGQRLYSSLEESWPNRVHGPERSVQSLYWRVAVWPEIHHLVAKCEQPRHLLLLCLSRRTQVSKGEPGNCT